MPKLVISPEAHIGIDARDDFRNQLDGDAQVKVFDSRVTNCLQRYPLPFCALIVGPNGPIPAMHSVGSSGESSRILPGYRLSSLYRRHGAFD